jgi:hypothetical protein
MATTTINLGLSLDGLSNVDTAGKANGDILRWNSVTNKWEDNALPTTAPAGSNGEIQFNNSGAFGADSGLLWDNTNKRLGVGASPASTVRLDVRAQGALSTDIAFRVRNSADSANLMQVSGDGRVGISTATPLANLHISSTNFGQDIFRVTYAAGATDIINAKSGGFGTGTLTFAPTDGVVCNATLKMGFNKIVGANSSYIELENPGGGNTSMNFRTASASNGLGFQFLNQLGTQIFQITRVGNIAVLNSTSIPSTNITDSFQLYSADITAGNAAPHFRTEAGDVIKLYKETTGVAAATLVGGGGTTLTDTDTFDGYTMQQVVKALRNLGILA